MKLPSAEEYIDIISEKTEELPTLRNFRFQLKDDGRTPFYKKSRRIIVFRATHNSKDYAIRFFLNDDPEFFRRYQQIQDYLENKSLSWKVPFQFLGEGYNPMLQMDWIDSLSLTQYLDLIITDPSRISQLQSKLVSLHQQLEGNGIGHGNLNMKHIRFVKQGADYVIKLIDYDSMFIPPFKEKDSFTSGTAGFQHPMRLSSDFSEKIDRFSFWVFLTVLEAFKIDPSLWQNAKQNGFNKEEQILFTYRDLGFPKQSNAFQLLKQYDSSALKFYTEKLLAFCTAASLENIEAPRLYEEKVFHANGNESLSAPKEVNTRIIKEKETKPVDVVPANSVLHQEAPVKIKEKSDRKQKPVISTNYTPTPKTFVRRKEKKKKPIAAFVIIGLLIVSAAAYLVWASQPKTASDAGSINNTSVINNTQPSVKEVAATSAQSASVFTSASITQFLSGLYQSYNKRELPSILSHYATTVQYYDAGSVNKNKLNSILNDLFIKPAHYECNPDLKTLQFNSEGNNCTITITNSETIRANDQSNTEHYSTKIEYVVDRSFKIKSEKNIE